MLINKGTNHNLQIALDNNDVPNILKSYSKRIKQVLDDKSWIKPPLKEDVVVMEKLLEDFNLKINQIQEWKQ